MGVRKSTTMFKIFSFKGGGRLILREMPHMETVSVGIWAGVGSRHESSQFSGISHFLEHMIFKGTARRSALNITREVEGIGGYLNAFTSEENTCYYARVAAAQFARVADVLSDMYLHSVLAPAEIEKERGVILEELSMVQDQPSQKVQENLNALLWTGHPLGIPIAGFEKTVSRMTRSNLQQYYRQNYHASNTVVSVAGKIDESTVREIFDPFFHALSGGRKASFKKYSPPRGRMKKSLSFEQKDVEQVNAVLGFRGLSRKHPLRYAAKILNVILGENMSSRLFQVIREQNGLAYSIGSGQSLFSDTGAFTVYAGLPSAKCDKAFRLVARELKRIKEKKVSAKEMSEAKDYASGMMTMGLESTTDQMLWGGESYFAYGRVFECEAIKRDLEAVSFEDVRAVANLLFQDENAALALISPKGSKKPVWPGIIDLN